jgi:hypothetical protein
MSPNSIASSVARLRRAELIAGDVAVLGHVAAVRPGDRRQAVVPHQRQQAGSPAIVVDEGEQFLFGLRGIDVVVIVLAVGGHVGGGSP